MSFPSKRRIALLVLAGILILSLGVMITMYVEVPAGQSHVEQVITSAAIISGSNQQIATETPWVMPTDIGHPHCANNVDFEFTRGTFEFHFYTTHGSGPYPDCTEEGISSISIYYVQEFIHYHLYINQEGYWEVSARNR